MHCICTPFDSNPREIKKAHANVWKIFLTAIFLVCLNGESIAQAHRENFTISGFTDVFYAYDFNRPKGPVRQPFLYSYNRQNEISVNLAYVSAAWHTETTRGVLALQGGTYVTDNYAAEDPEIRLLHEAWVGVSLNASKSVWLDAGIMPSHLGFESATAMENWTLGRSLSAESSPYFLSAAKLTWNHSGKLQLSALVTNGWQRVKRVPGNSLISSGTQVVYRPSAATLFNWSTFFGADEPDNARMYRVFNNIYVQHKVSSKLQALSGFDVGFRQAAKGDRTWNPWFVASALIRYQWQPRIFTTFRAEYLHDPDRIVASLAPVMPMLPMVKTSLAAFSVNADYAVRENTLLRAEIRHFQNADAVFLRGTMAVRGSTGITVSLSTRF
jgi:hypothetical protein